MENIASSIAEPPIELEPGRARSEVQEVRAGEADVESYRRLAAIFHDVLSEQDLDAVLERIADTLGELIPYDTLTVYRADVGKRRLLPILARDPWEAEEILNSAGAFGEGVTGFAAETLEPVLANDAHLDPRSKLIEGTELNPESLIAVPLIARQSLKGVLAIYRLGESRFNDEEFRLAKLFGDAAALALDNAQIRAFLEHQAQTDSLTGAYNHRFFQERLRSELTRASRSHDAVGLLMFDIDDFKKLNDVYGHALGDQVLIQLAEMLKATVRASDVVCRLGGEEFAVIMPSCDAGDALGLASRIAGRLGGMEFEPAGKVTISLGIAQGPEHAANPRELLHCAEAAMMTAKARGKNRIVLFDETSTERPEVDTTKVDVRSIAHLKMLQSLSGKLSRLNDVRAIGNTIATELRTLIDYHNCRIYTVHDDYCVPICFMGEWTLAEGADEVEMLPMKVGQGITGTVAETCKPALIPDARECEFAMQLPGTADIEESVLAVPMCFGARSIGVILLSKLGVGQFDEDDVRLMEVLAGQAAVSLENARLYEEQTREADKARALLEAAQILSNASSFGEVKRLTVDLAMKLLDANQSSLWLQNDSTGMYTCAAHLGYEGDPTAEAIVHEVVDGPTAARFLAGRDRPFVFTNEESEEVFNEPPSVVSRRVVVAPLAEGDGVKGWIIVREPSDLHSDFLAADRLRLFAAYAHQASVALQKAVLYKDQRDTAEIANSLLEFGHSLAITETLGEVLSRVAELAARVLGGAKTSIWLQDIETGDLVPEAQWGHDDVELDRFVGARFPAKLTAKWLEREWPFILRPELLEQVHQMTEHGRQRVYAVAPLHLQGGRNGCLVASSHPDDGYEFTDKRLRLLTGMAQQSRLAINNALNFESLEGTFIATVEALANALEAKDEYTSSHARSITDMSVEVGAALGLEPKDLKRLELSALFHDIGKIGVPSNILLKPGPLTEEERKAMELHPELGARILAPIDRLREVTPIIRACHERFDGGGYPDGLAGHEVPLEARIIFVCDAFDAMTTDRPYRKRLPTAEAIARLREGAGTQFDPDIVELFTGLIEASNPPE
ncbi:MAG TPA: diguanylate cyclase [Actinomycetota bacterium]|nr:diguanylate cyclase [Actinomycetota bacterium]